MSFEEILYVFLKSIGTEEKKEQREYACNVLWGLQVFYNYSEVLIFRGLAF